MPNDAFLSPFLKRSYFALGLIIFKHKNWRGINLLDQPSYHQVFFFSLCQTSSASIAWYGPKRTDECFLWFIWLKGLVQVAARAAPEAKAWFPWAHGIICGNYWSPFDPLYHDFVYHPPLHEQPQMFIPLLYKLPIHPKHTHIHICHNVSFLFEMMQVFLYKEFLEGFHRSEILLQRVTHALLIFQFIFLIALYFVSESLIFPCWRIIHLASKCGKVSLFPQTLLNL